MVFNMIVKGITSYDTRIDAAAQAHLRFSE